MSEAPLSVEDDTTENEESLVASLGVIAPGPRLSVPRVSILTVAEVVTHADDLHGGGVGFRSDGKPEGGVYDLCAPDGLDAGSVVGPLEFEAFGIVAEDHSSSFGFTVGEHRERAIRKLLAIEPYLIEREFYLDSLGPKIALASSEATEVTSSAVSLLDGFALAEDTAAQETLGGYRAIFHVRPSILTYWEHLGVVRREGNLWLTPTDNIVLPGRGYTGESPDNDNPSATSEWIYLTTGLTIHRGPVRTTPDTLSEALNRSDNTITFYASRQIAVVWDHEVLHHAIEVNPSELFTDADNA